MGRHLSLFYSYVIHPPPPFNWMDNFEGESANDPNFAIGRNRESRPLLPLVNIDSRDNIVDRVILPMFPHQGTQFFRNVFPSGALRQGQWRGSGTTERERRFLNWRIGKAILDRDCGCGGICSRDISA